MKINTTSPISKPTRITYMWGNKTILICPCGKEYASSNDTKGICPRCGLLPSRFLWD